MLDKILGLPAKYIQGPGALDRIGDVAADLGGSAFVMADGFVLGLVGARVKASLTAANVAFQTAEFQGECCRSEIDRLVALARAGNNSFVIAIGGGKALDAGKAVTSEIGGAMISAPTIASTDGPVSSIAVEYSEDHTHIGVMRFNRSPAVVLVDSAIVAQAPARLLVAGMGDGLATWFEARACKASGKTNFRGGAISELAMTPARYCYETILTYGRDALADVTENRVSDAVERVIEANVFLSGVGFENTGVAGAHALDTAVSRFSNDHSIQHGERVALGILFQLTLEDAQDDIAALSDVILREGSPIRNLPFEVSKADIMAALTTFHHAPA